MRKEFSVSQLKTYLTCRRKWYINYVLKAENDAGYAANLGSILHILVDAYHTRKEVDFIDLEERFPRVIIDEGLRLFEIYKVADDIHPFPIEGDGFTPEVKLEMEVAPGLWLTGRCDFLYFDEDGNLVIGETKTSGREWSLWEMHLNFQTKLYALMASNMFPLAGKKVYVLYNVIKTIKERKTKPIMPDEILQRQLIKVEEQALKQAFLEVSTLIKEVDGFSGSFDDAVMCENFLCKNCYYKEMCISCFSPADIMGSFYYKEKIKEEDRKI
jgi:CRISPR/Cas system-associated exonuclease Cas4 (RecB family)